MPSWRGTPAHFEMPEVTDAQREMKTKSFRQTQFVRQQVEFEHQVGKKTEIDQKEPDLEKKRTANFKKSRGNERHGYCD